MFWGGKLTSICSKSTRTCSSETSCNDCAVGSSPYDAEEFLWAELGFSFSFLILMLVSRSSWEREKSISNDPFSFTQQTTCQRANPLTSYTCVIPLAGGQFKPFWHEKKKPVFFVSNLVYWLYSHLHPKIRGLENQDWNLSTREKCSWAPLPFLSPPAAQNWKHLMYTAISVKCPLFPSSFPIINLARPSEIPSFER